MIPKLPKRVVLDTNVCLDLFVFRDRRWAALLTALQEKTIEAITRADCRKEWLLVLEYPHLPLDAEKRQHSIAEFDALIACIAPPAAEPDNVVRLPVCKDRDDQKFLEVARDAGAEVLITKDKALLKCAKRTAKAGLFRIATPEAWVKEQDFLNITPL
jgi:putative PIN family toxin of toxin-antitoxin system